MSCALPPELKERDLLAYLDGEAGAGVSAHVEGCAHCRERAAALARVQGRLVAGLYRADCPSPHELGEYHLGVLPGGRAAAVEAHLAGCPHCAAEVAQLRGYLDALAPDVTPGLVQRAAGQLRVLVARLVAGAQGGPRLVPAAALRGEGEGPRIYQAGDVQIAVEAQDGPGASGDRALLGLITGAGTIGWTARLERQGEPAAAAPVDELGNFILSPVAPGTYDLVLAAPDLEIRVESLAVAGQGIENDSRRADRSTGRD